MDQEDLKFPKNFLWGASTASHQIEGGNHNSWSKWELENADSLAKTAADKYSRWLPGWDDLKSQMQNPANYISGRSTDHFNNYKEDIQLAKKLNLKAFRLSLEWSRIEPLPDQYDLEAIAHYREVIKEIRAAGIEPVVTLWHWTLPLWVSNLGGWKNPETQTFFQKYVRRTVRELGKNVNYWITLNEPGIYSHMSYFEQRWPPQERSLFSYLIVFFNLIRAHRTAFYEIKKQFPKSKVGLAKHVVYFEAHKNRPLNLIAKFFADYWINKFFFNRSIHEQDFIGVNHYFHNRIVRGKFNRNERKHTSDMGWDLTPESIYKVVKLASKYRKPILITEHGLADGQDKHRGWYVKESLRHLHKAISEGANVIGYLHWSLLDNFEWDQGFWPRFGLIEVDYKTLERKVRGSAKEYAHIALENSIPNQKIECDCGHDHD